MSKVYSYELHIAATPDDVWKALTQNEFWQKYWDEWQIASEWRPGAPLTFRTADGVFFSEGRVLAAEQPTKLTYTWPNPPEEQGKAPDEQLAWSIETSGVGVTRLQLEHTNLSDEAFEGVSKGWPAILSSLKSVLETGRPLMFPDQVT